MFIFFPGYSYVDQWTAFVTLFLKSNTHWALLFFKKCYIWDLSLHRTLNAFRGIRTVQGQKSKQFLRIRNKSNCLHMWDYPPMFCYPTSDDCDFNLHYLKLLFRVNGVKKIFRTFPCIFLCKIRTHYIVQWIHPIPRDQDFKIKISWHYLRILPHRIQLFWPISLNPSCGPPYQRRS